MAWPPVGGWGLKGDRGAFDGRIFRLTGKSLSIFRTLVEAGDDGIRAHELKLAVWDAETDDKIMENALTKLRSALREALELETEDNPVRLDEGRYRLTDP